MSRALFVAVTVLVAVLAGAPAASASDTQCSGLLTGTFDNLVIPENETCILVNSVVFGNIKVLPNARLFADSNHVHGNVEGDKADLVEVYDRPEEPAPSIVGGNIQAKEGNEGVLICGTELPEGNIQIEKFSGPNAFVLVGDDTHCGPFGGGNMLTKGSIQVQENAIGVFVRDAFGIDDNSVGQNIQVFKNTGPGNKTVNRNTGGGSLQCFDNTPPFDGTGNTFPHEEGQCN